MPSQKQQNNKKRSRIESEQKEWNWEDTVLANDDSSMLGKEIQSLLSIRGCTTKQMKKRKAENIAFLKENYSVDLDKEFADLTAKECVLELKLRGLNFSMDRKNVLVQRLNGEIDATAPPPKKKQKRGANLREYHRKKFVFALFCVSEKKRNFHSDNRIKCGCYRMFLQQQQRMIRRRFWVFTGRRGRHMVKEQSI